MGILERTVLRVHWDAVSTGQYCRLLLQDFWTVQARDYLALIDSTGNRVEILRQGTLVYLTPTVIPHAVVDAASLAASC